MNHHAVILQGIHFLSSNMDWSVPRVAQLGSLSWKRALKVVFSFSFSLGTGRGKVSHTAVRSLGVQQL